MAKSISWPKAPPPGSTYLLSPSVVSWTRLSSLDATSAAATPWASAYHDVTRSAVMNDLAVVVEGWGQVDEIIRTFEGVLVMSPRLRKRLRHSQQTSGGASRSY